MDQVKAVRVTGQYCGFWFSDNPMEDKSLTDTTPLDVVWVINLGGVRVDRVKLNHPEQLAIKGTKSTTEYLVPRC